MPIQLTPENEQRLLDQKAAIDNATYELRRAERAGLDVTDLKAQVAELEKMRVGLLRTYSAGATAKLVR
jgi:hypothetical protein